MKPTRPINVNGNPSWKYRDSDKTNVAATFARLRREQREAAERSDRAAQANAGHIKLGTS
ncbi:MAG: hypothetical protein NUV34_05850 [Sulfuricaulis sp.]|nr:hypothetical protein [Sulfuricaulis sp.]